MNSANLYDQLQPKILCFSLPARLIGPQLMQRLLSLLGFLSFFFFPGRWAESGPGTIFACGFTEKAREAWLPASMLGYTHPDLEWWRTVADSESCICKLSTFCFLRNSRLISASKQPGRGGGGEMCFPLHSWRQSKCLFCVLVKR